MAKSIEVLSFTQLPNGAYRATGTVEERPFTAQTILYGPKGQKKQIFKILESNEDGELRYHLMTNSGFTRGDRIAVARRLRVELVRRRREAKLVKLSVKELRTQAREAGLKGYWKRDVRKSDLVTMLAA